VLPALLSPPAADLAAVVGSRWDGVVAAYLAEVGQRTGSVRTPQEYGRILDRFLARLLDPAAASAAHVHAFAYAPGPSGRAPSPSTITVRLAAIRGLYDFARRMGLTSSNPATSEHVRRPRQRPPTPRGLSADELRRLLAAMPTEKPSGLRDRAIILTCVFTALRWQDVMRLRAGDLTQDGAVYYRIRTKGGLERHRELPRPAVAAIVHYLERIGCRLEELPPATPLWDVSDMTFYANLRRYARKAGLPHVTPHVLRHAAAKLRRVTGASLEDVSALLGHRSIATTARYLARLEGEQDTGWPAVAALLGVG
jgi:integrase/recombinase XerD